jgi:hypothetical protein
MMPFILIVESQQIASRSNEMGSQERFMPKTMKAAFVEKFGEPLKIREVVIPTPGPDKCSSR